MSVKEIIQYEYTCDICKLKKKVEGGSLPGGWYEVICRVEHNPEEPVYSDNDVAFRVCRREAAKTMHLCKHCAIDSTKDIFVRPAEMFDD